MLCQLQAHVETANVKMYRFVCFSLLCDAIIFAPANKQKILHLYENACNVGYHSNLVYEITVDIFASSPPIKASFVRYPLEVHVSKPKLIYNAIARVRLCFVKFHKYSAEILCQKRNISWL